MLLRFSEFLLKTSQAATDSMRSGTLIEQAD